MMDLSFVQLATDPNLIQGVYNAWLQVMALDDADPRVEHMRRHLARLRREVEGRFPAARAFVRPGLDQGKRSEPRNGIILPASC